MTYINPRGILSVLSGKKISSLRTQVSSLFLQNKPNSNPIFREIPCIPWLKTQNEPNFTFKIKLVNLFIIIYYGILTRFSDWVRFFKRTQFNAVIAQASSLRSQACPSSFHAKTPK